ncbi:hypothetical protein [Vampirovibrio chlorellavorus]|uniref:hypothetical protein n=1 Tax=Vampirovibrio chlorellavorus TaxID=758823 RepID=UPI0026EB6707|nr:hypothetical protein [Vampirovibrio chlorellavorus]
MSYNLNSVIGLNYGAQSLYQRIRNNAENNTADYNKGPLFDALDKRQADGLTVRDVIGLETDYGVDLDGDGQTGSVLGVTEDSNTEEAVGNQTGEADVKSVSADEMKALGQAFEDAGKTSFTRADLQQLASTGSLDGKQADPALQRSATALLNNPEILDKIDVLDGYGESGAPRDQKYWASNFTSYGTNAAAGAVDTTGAGSTDGTT